MSPGAADLPAAAPPHACSGGFQLLDLAERLTRCAFALFRADREPFRDHDLGVPDAHEAED